MRTARTRVDELEVRKVAKASQHVRRKGRVPMQREPSGVVHLHVVAEYHHCDRRVVAPAADTHGHIVHRVGGVSDTRHILLVYELVQVSVAARQR